MFQMEAQMHTAASLSSRYSVCVSSYTAHAAAQLCASFAWRTWAMMMLSGIATGAVAVCCIWCAYKLGVASRLLLQHTLPPHILPGAQNCDGTFACGFLHSLAAQQGCHTYLSNILHMMDSNDWHVTPETSLVQVHIQPMLCNVHMHGAAHVR